MFTSVSLFYLEAQTLTWTGGGDGFNWSDPDNWDLIMVPTASNDVVIPDGSTLTINVLSTAKSITINGTSTVNINNTLNIEANSSVSDNSVINWNSGYMSGNTSFDNYGKINLPGVLTVGVWNDLVINNYGEINLLSTGDLDIFDGVLNNKLSGVIDFQSDGANIGYLGGTVHILNNSGTIKKSGGSGNSLILAQLNNSGTVSVETGTLDMNNALTEFHGGSYNVSSPGIMNWSGTVNIFGELTGVIEGSLNWMGTVSVSDQASFNFTGSMGLNWLSWTLLGGGTLTNHGVLNLAGTSLKRIDQNTTLANEGVINIQSIGHLDIFDGILNNKVSGVIDFQSDGANIGYLGGAVHTLNNEGIIKKSGGSGISSILARLNNSGTISVQTGTLELNNALIQLQGGTYNVSSAGILNWSNAVNISGELTGVIEGSLNWMGTVSVIDQASFNFSGSKGLNWMSWTLLGGGTLTNRSILNLAGTSLKRIDQNTTLDNEGVIIILSTGDLDIFDGVLNNKASGIIDFQSDGANIGYLGGTVHMLNNFGTIKKTISNGVSQIYVETHNSGIIEILTGILEFYGTQPFWNETLGLVKGIGSIDLPIATLFTNDGTFAPGSSPGTLTVLGDFKSSDSSILEIELNGSGPGITYDVLNIQGNAIFKGGVQVTMGYEGVVNDEFIIATTTGTITECSLPPSVSSVFDGKTFNFDLKCRNNNEVVLTVKDIALGMNDEASVPVKINIFPNPTESYFTIRNEKNLRLKSVAISDIGGRILKRIALEKTDKEISISMDTFDYGCYFVTIELENENITGRIIKM